MNKQVLEGETFFLYDSFFSTVCFCLCVFPQEENMTIINKITSSKEKDILLIFHCHTWLILLMV